MSVPDEGGLESLKFYEISEAHFEILQSCFGEIISKCENLHTLEINLIQGKLENKAVFLDVALDIIRTSTCLRKLQLSYTNTTKEHGLDFLNEFANVESDALEHLDLHCDEREKMRCKWF